MSLYGTDLAYVHDAGFSGFVEAAIPGVLRRLRGRRGTVLDLGCGAGRLARALSKEGFLVFAVDASPAMARLAKTHAPKAAVRAASVLSVSLPAAAAACAVGEIVNYLPAGSLPRFLRRVADALEPGGLFLFDSRRPFAPSGTRGAFARDWAVLARTEGKGRRLTRRIACFRRAGGRWRRSDEAHPVTTYGSSELLRLLRRAGFSARTARGYDEALPEHFVFVAHKR